MLNTVASSRVIADGGADIDTLNFNAINNPIQTTPNSISSGRRIDRSIHVNFETVANQNTLGAIPTVTINSPSTNPAIDGDDTVHLAGGARRPTMSARDVGDVGEQPRRQRRGDRHDDLDGGQHPAAAGAQRAHRDGERPRAGQRRRATP